MHCADTGTHRVRSAAPVLCGQIPALQPLLVVVSWLRGVRRPTLMTLARSSRPGFVWSFMVRRGLWLRLAGVLVREELEPLAWAWAWAWAVPFLRRDGSESLDVSLGRGIAGQHRRNGLRLFTERGTCGLGCAAKNA